VTVHKRYGLNFTIIDNGAYMKTMTGDPKGNYYRADDVDESDEYKDSVIEQRNNEIRQKNLEYAGLQIDLKAWECEAKSFRRLHDELEAENKRLCEWKKLMEDAPGEAREVIRERFLGGQSIKPIIESWKKENGKLKLQLGEAVAMIEKRALRYFEGRSCPMFCDEMCMYAHEYKNCAGQMNKGDCKKAIIRHLEREGHSPSGRIEK